MLLKLVVIAINRTVPQMSTFFRSRNYKKCKLLCVKQINTKNNIDHDDQL